MLARWINNVYTIISIIIHFICPFYLKAVQEDGGIHGKKDEILENPQSTENANDASESAYSDATSGQSTLSAQKGDKGPTGKPSLEIPSPRKSLNGERSN